MLHTARRASSNNLGANDISNEYSHQHHLQERLTTTIHNGGLQVFARGNCKYGASCRNSHDTSQASTIEPSALPSASRQKEPTGRKKNASSPELNNSAPVCWFHTHSKCIYGAACRKSHDAATLESVADLRPNIPNGSSSPSSKLAIIRPPLLNQGAEYHSLIGAVTASTKLNADVSAFVPSSGSLADPQNTNNSYQAHPCIFFAKGYCKNGESCVFRHESDVFVTDNNGERNGKTDITPLETAATPLFITTSLQHDINGASVTFETGGELSKIRLCSDFSTIHVSGSFEDVQPAVIIALLAELGYNVEESSIRIKAVGKFAVAEIKYEDPNFAKDVTASFSTEQINGTSWSISIKPWLGSLGSGGFANRLQLNTVTCTWYKPSRYAWLSFDIPGEAHVAKRAIEASEIRQRRPTCSFNPHNHSTLLVGNLDVRTRKKDIYKALEDSLRPNSITLGDPSHDCSNAVASEFVKKFLETKATLESFQMHADSGGAKLKATASFTDREEAAKAIKLCNGALLPKLGDCKLLLSHVISVKYNVPNAVLKVLRESIDKLAIDVWEIGHVHLRVYPEQGKPVTAVRVYGESLKEVTGAKAKLEKLLEGTLVMDGDVALWSPEFLSADSLAFLNETGKTNSLYVRRDARKYQLVLLGGTEDSRARVTKELVNKVSALRLFNHSIVLTSELLRMTMRGGMRQLKARFGSKVALNVSANPKTISLTGSRSDLEEAHQLLMSDATAISNETAEESCVICWTEDTELLETSCGHTYCKECFANQTSSGEIPVRCYGAEGSCLHVFSLHELRTLLSLAAFQKLLEVSFDSYIRQHPKKFQHCPTPDCPQVYRLTSTGQTFFCTSCLTSICTACNATAHDGLTCEEYQDLASGGMMAFQKWKKEIGARNCPNCKAVIEKDGGCHHVDCHQCHTHICWACMGTFPHSDECYTHMRSVHGGYYDDDAEFEPVPIE